jgi:hypothetical protein
MAAFDDIKLEWQGKTFVIPARKTLEAIACVEEVLTMHELSVFLTRGTAPMGRVARAFGALLRYAGAQAFDDEVYAGLFGDGADAIPCTMEVVHLLQLVMVPPSVRTRLEERVAAASAVVVHGEASSSGNPKAASGKASSKPATSSRSGRNGSRPVSSGA